jgi:ferritin-like metal-binding protein YciE
MRERAFARHAAWQSPAGSPPGGSHRLETKGTRMPPKTNGRHQRTSGTVDAVADFHTSDQARAKLLQYLSEAHATERALIRTLQTHISVTPAGKYRSGLERHLRETRSHADRVGQRLEGLGISRNPLAAWFGVTEMLVGQALVLAKGPFDLLRGSGGEEKLLKNAKDEAATEALEITTYLALEQLAHRLGDEETAQLAASIRAEEERMLEQIREHIAALTDDVVAADIAGDPKYDISRTGAADAAREVGGRARTTARKAGSQARRTARQARKVPGVAAVEGEVKGAVASAEDLPIAGYDELTADEIVSRLPELSQIDLHKVDAYERKNDNRQTVRQRIDALRGDEPWPGYDEQNVAEIRAALSEADEDTRKQVREYERKHKDRAGVIATTEREPAGAGS